MSQLNGNKKPAGSGEWQREVFPSQLTDPKAVDSTVEREDLSNHHSIEPSLLFHGRQLSSMKSITRNNLSQQQLGSQSQLVASLVSGEILVESALYGQRDAQIMNIDDMLHRNSIPFENLAHFNTATMIDVKSSGFQTHLSGKVHDTPQRLLYESQPAHAASVQNAAASGGPANFSFAAGGNSQQSRSASILVKPKRPLSAYNVFFQEERARIIEEREGNRTTPQVNLPTSQKIRYQPNGTGFEDLAKEISKRWKHVGEERLRECTQRANTDTIRYQTELAVYNEEREEKLSALQRAQEATVSEETWAQYLAAAESQKPSRVKKRERSSHKSSTKTCKRLTLS